MDFYAILDQVIDVLRQRQRVTYRALKRQFNFDDDYLEDVKAELIQGQRLAVDEEGAVLVWTGETGTAAPAAATPTEPPARAPLAYTPAHLAEKIVTARPTLAGERKQVTVLFADLKGSLELLADRDPEEARQLLDAVLERMMTAVHRYEGTVNQIMGDGIMALFGAPLAHEDHAVRACYAALAMQAALRRYSEEMRRTQGLAVHFRVGLNAGEVVVRAISNDLHMDYSAIGQTVHLAARMEQLATPGSILLTGATLRLVEGLVQVTPLGPVPVKGLEEPVEIFELVGASHLRRRLQAAAARGLTLFVGRQQELEAVHQALARAQTGHGQVVALVGEAGVGKSRLVHEVVHSHRTQDWRVLESASVSYGKATPYFPVIDLLKRYCHVDDGDDVRTIRAKVTGQVLTLDETLQDTLPALLALLDAGPEDSPFLQLDPSQRRQRTLDGLKRVLLRESQVQPLLLVFEDLHWIDTETQALLDHLVESLPTARLLLLINYRPEYQHGWGSKTYYTQLRLDPLPPASAEELLQALLGDDPSLAPLLPLLSARTAGNPFFLEESVRTLVETGVLVGTPGAYRLATPLQGIPVPATVQAVLAARIDRLPPEDKHLLQTAAVIGTDVPFALLRAIADVPEVALHRGLAHLQASEFLYETHLFPESEYTFKHALTHEVAYNSLLLERRRELHERTAQALEARYAERLEEHASALAHHYQHSGNRDKAVEYLYRAGRQAVQHTAHTDGITHLTAALHLLQTLPDTVERRQQELLVQTALGPALLATRSYGDPELAQVYARAYELCQQVGGAPQFVPVLWGLWFAACGRAELARAYGLGEHLLGLGQRGPDPTSRLVGHTALGVTLVFQGDLLPARRHLEQGVAAYEPQQHRPLAGVHGVDFGTASHAFLGMTLILLGYPDQGRQHSEAALRLAREAAHPFTLASALLYACILRQWRREVQHTLERAEAGVALATAQGSTLRTAQVTMFRGWALARQGAVETGLAQCRQALMAFRATGAAAAQSYYLGLLAEVCGQARQVAEGVQVLHEALTCVEHTGERFVEAELWRCKGELLLQSGVWESAPLESPSHHPHAAEAAACFEQALAVARAQGARWWELRAAMSLARLWQQQGQRAEAYELLAPIYDWFTEGFDTADLQDTRALLEALT